jgi:hypothetical protein
MQFVGINSAQKANKLCAHKQSHVEDCVNTTEKGKGMI